MIQCGGRLVPTFSTLFAIRADMRHQCCVMECVCGLWCRINKGYASLHETLIAILLHGLRLKRQTNGNTITVGGQKPTLENSIDKDQVVCYASMMLTAPVTINSEKKGLL